MKLVDSSKLKNLLLEGTKFNAVGVGVDILVNIEGIEHVVVFETPEENEKWNSMLSQYDEMRSKDLAEKFGDSIIKETYNRRELAEWQDDMRDALLQRKVELLDGAKIIVDEADMLNLFVVRLKLNSNKRNVADDVEYVTNSEELASSVRKVLDEGKGKYYTSKVKEQSIFGNNG